MLEHKNYIVRSHNKTQLRGRATYFDSAVAELPSDDCLKALLHMSFRGRASTMSVLQPRKHYVRSAVAQALCPFCSRASTMSVLRSRKYSICSAVAQALCPFCSRASTMSVLQSRKHYVRSAVAQVLNLFRGRASTQVVPRSRKQG